MTKEQLAEWYMDKFSDLTLSKGCYILSDDGTKGFIIYSDDVKVLIREEGLHYNSSQVWFVFKTRIKRNYGHPLTRGRLYQEIYNMEISGFAGNSTRGLGTLLLDNRLLDKTIHERVENEEVFKVLLSIKEQLDD